MGAIGAKALGWRGQIGLFGDFEPLEDGDCVEPPAWAGEEERELFALRTIGALLEESLERLPEMDETERGETLAWIFLLGPRAVIPFDYACRLYGLNPRQLREEIRERYPGEVERLLRAEIAACSIS